MRYVQLRAFHFVATQGGFSRAAEALSLTQPAISDQVRKLECEYDVLLFNRQKKQVALTDFGKKLLEITHRMFDVEHQAHELLSESRALGSANLKIIADSVQHLHPILGPFRQQYPEVFISVSTGNTSEIIEKLCSYEADVGVLGEIPEAREFDVVKLSSTPIIAFASKRSSAGGMKSISLQELASKPLVLREKGSKTRQKLEQIAAAAGLTLKPSIEAVGREAIREIVASGAGIGIVSEAEFGFDERLCKIAISGCEPLMDEALICLKERSKSNLVGAFMKMAQDRLKLESAA
ncbi:LysR substrate-binding domain-containing protein [Sneathiella sp. HT1-7]|jgi:aminoethylphosphonate catabolism LysR family transcriptional regulator|uniref:LysR substrate-binding domain-containing protein n=1 Tax=Sneathiella sp. HT1-7 TaxID=2887192 RepID=UPI001D15BA74|nr:LysR substrate-binding domain-containing protein [Sneathiella sp. HT1-7]MCC3306302.1 LysR family transcriptional regulator [Sneathiella sp. HT1-7]